MVQNGNVKSLTTFCRHMIEMIKRLLYFLFDLTKGDLFDMQSRALFFILVKIFSFRQTSEVINGDFCRFVYFNALFV